MRCLATSDLHLGFRQFAATEGGRNARELDVEHAWYHLVDRAVELQPDLITIAGDVFHHPRSGFHAVMAYRDGIRRMHQKTRATIVIVQGNHDAVRTADALSPIVIPNDYERVHILTEPGRVSFETQAGEKVAVACFPFVGMGEPKTYRLEPDPEFNVNVLLLHAAVKSSENPKALPWFYQGPHSLDVGREAERWDVIACGDFHEYTRLHPERAVFYSGSIERTSSNIWDEHKPKGFVVCETKLTGEVSVEFCEIPTRMVYDETADDGDSVECLNLGLESRLADPSTKDAITRLKVDAFPRSQRDAIDWSLVRQLKAHCLHFYLDLRFATDESAEISDRRQARSLQEEATEFLAGEEEAVLECALGYLQPPIEDLEPEEVEA